MSKQFLGVIIVIVLIITGLFVFGGESNAPTANASATSHTRGAGTKKVTLTEYGDFQCPACRQYYPAVEETIEFYKDDITFQFRHFPLTNIHQNAFAASRAAEAAGLQGKFFEMYNILYQNQDLWKATPAPQATFEQYATQLKLDVVKFKADYASSKVNDAINADMAAGNKLGISSTPSFFINGKQIQLNSTAEDFKKVIDAEIKKVNPTGPNAELNAPTSETNPSGDAAPESTDPAAAAAQ